MYLGEFKLHWRSLTGAVLGMGLGSAFGHYTMSLFGPPLLEEFGWSKSQFALIGSVPILTLFLIPVAGRFVDRFGTRLSAMIGFSVLPLGFLAYPLMTGNIAQFFLIWGLQHIFGVLTTSMVFCRVVVERFDLSRGVALSVVMTAPPLAGAIAAPLLGQLIDAEGWRIGYVALAVITALGGLASISMMGRTARKASVNAPDRSLSRSELGALLRQRTLILIIVGMFLVNIPQVFAASQLKLIAMDGGVSSGGATVMVSLYALGVILGRFLSGFALDRIAPHLVAIAALGLPAIGYLIFAMHIGSFGLLAAGVALIGLAQGAESDIGAFILSRQFDMKNFSLLLSFLTAMVGLGSTAGSLILSLTLKLTDSYTIFLLVSAVATLLGALMFALTGRQARPNGRNDVVLPVEKRVLEQALSGEI